MHSCFKVIGVSRKNNTLIHSQVLTISSLLSENWLRAIRLNASLETSVRAWSRFHLVKYLRCSDLITHFRVLEYYAYLIIIIITLCINSCLLRCWLLCRWQIYSTWAPEQQCFSNVTFCVTHCVVWFLCIILHAMWDSEEGLGRIPHPRHIAISQRYYWPVLISKRL